MTPLRGFGLGFVVLLGDPFGAWARIRSTSLQGLVKFVALSGLSYRDRWNTQMDLIARVHGNAHHQKH
jgi:hypothetical protein